MAARATKGDFKAAAAQGLGHVGIGARAINDEKGMDGILPRSRGENVAHAAQVALAFFTHVADENDVGCKMELGAFERRGYGQNRYVPGCIITDARRVGPGPFLARLQTSAQREDRLQMCAHADRRLRKVLLEKAKDVAQVVGLDFFQAERREPAAQPLATSGFSKGRRRSLRHFALPAPELHFLIVQIEERRMDAAHLGDPRYFLLSRNGRARADQWTTAGHGLSQYYILRRMRSRQKQSGPERPLCIMGRFPSYFGGGVVPVSPAPFLLFLLLWAFLVLAGFLPLSAFGAAAGACVPVVLPPAWANDRLPASSSANTNVASFFIDSLL